MALVKATAKSCKIPSQLSHSLSMFVIVYHHFPYERLWKSHSYGIPHFQIHPNHDRWWDDAGMICNGDEQIRRKCWSQCLARFGMWWWIQMIQGYFSARIFETSESGRNLTWTHHQLSPSTFMLSSSQPYEIILYRIGNKLFEAISEFQRDTIFLSFMATT